MYFSELFNLSKYLTIKLPYIIIQEIEKCLYRKLKVIHLFVTRLFKYKIYKNKYSKLLNHS